MDGLGNALKFNDEIEIDFPDDGEFAGDGEYIETGTEPTFEDLFPEVCEMVDNISVFGSDRLFFGDNREDAFTLNTLDYPAIVLKDGCSDDSKCWGKIAEAIQGKKIFLIQGSFGQSQRKTKMFVKLLRDRNDIRVIRLCRCWQDMPKDKGLAEFFDIEGNINRFPDLMKTAEAVRSEDQKLEAFNLVRGSEVEMKETEWLWYPFIPRGQVSLLSGDPGGGKTWIALWMSAQITQRREFPEQVRPATHGNGVVVYFSAEDDYQSTILPRVQAMGGNLENFYFLGSEDVIEDFGSPNIKYTVEKYKPDLIVFDAVSSFIGDKADMNKANKVRGGIRKVMQVIDGTNTAVVLIAHNNKMSSETNAQYRVSGSVDFSAAARSGMTVARNPEDKEEIVMAQFKNNLARFGKSCGFRIEDNDAGRPALGFFETLDMTANELLGGSSGNSETPKKSSPKMDEAKEALEEMLDEGGTGWIKAASAIKTLLDDYGCSKATAQRARSDLGLKVMKRKPEDVGREVTYWVQPEITLPEHPDVEQMGFKEV